MKEENMIIEGDKLVQAAIDGKSTTTGVPTMTETFTRDYNKRLSQSDNMRHEWKREAGEANES